jgi:hypothetical protein
MYANLRVTNRGDENTARAACEVRITEAGQVYIVEDLADGEGAYAVPGETYHVDPAEVGSIEIRADF